MFRSLPVYESKSEKIQVEREPGNKCPKILAVPQGKKKVEDRLGDMRSTVRTGPCLVPTPRAGTGPGRYLLSICWTHKLTSKGYQQCTLGLNLPVALCLLPPSAWQGDSCKHQQRFQPALGMASASHHLLTEAVQKKATPGRWLASWKLPYACHKKVNSCSNRKAAVARAGGLLTQAPPRRGDEG